MANGRKSVPRPDSVTVGHRTYGIRWLEDEEWLKTNGLDDTMHGCTKHHSGELFLRLAAEGDRFREDALRETLMHEVSHVVSGVSSLSAAWEVIDPVRRNDYNEVEELFTCSMSGPWLLFVKNNPDVLAYLLDDMDHE